MIVFLVFLSLFSFTSAAPLPVVLWHGMGDSCCDPNSMGWIEDTIKKEIPGVYIYSVALSNDDFADREKTFFANMNDEIDKVCANISSNAHLAGGYNAIGFSQGGQFLRAIAQRCPAPRMHNLITLGAQHQGVYGLPHCIEDNDICDTIRYLLDLGAYIDFIQSTVVQAQYYHDSDDEDMYKDKSIFIADINNEKVINETYRENLAKLDNFVLLKFTEDSMVVPRDSSWFGFYKEKDIETVLQYNQTKLYTEDRIGLKQLDESGRLHFLTMKGDHLKIDIGIFVKDIIDIYLK